MADVLNPNPPPSPPISEKKSDMPMLYYGLAVIGTAAIAIALYNLIIIKRCGRRHIQSPSRPDQTRLVEAVRVSNGGTFDQTGLTNYTNLVSSFKFKKGEGGRSVRDSDRDCDCDRECVVCLSGFEEGEEVRKLPRCNHWFHVECIDMWLCSHFDCPICRTPVLHFSRPTPEESSGDVLLQSAINGVAV